MSGTEPFTVGVEEEFQLVDAETMELRPRAEQVIPRARTVLGERVQAELNLSQIEVGTPICRSLDELRKVLGEQRRALMEAAAQTGSAILATGTHPFSNWLGQQITPKERYQQLDSDYQQLAWEQLICGCHVHVSVHDRELAIAVMNRSRPWLAVLLALGANSPFWEGVDTGYASYRTQVWDRWPTTGTPGVFENRAGYDELVAALIATGSIVDATRIYWDLRPSVRFETLEFRVADVALHVDDAVMIAGLARSLTRTCHAAALAQEPFCRPRPELLRAARWRAARYGLDADLVDVVFRRAVPARDLVHRLLRHLRPDLEAHGEWEEVSGLVERALTRGTGARRQRELLAEVRAFRPLCAAISAETVS